MRTRQQWRGRFNSSNYRFLQLSSRWGYLADLTRDSGQTTVPKLINLKTGEFKLDEYDLIIHPDLTMSAFKAGDIPFEELLSNEKGEISFRFNGNLETLDAIFHIYFTRGVLHRFSVFFDERYKLGQGGPISDWLTKLTGHAPPFEYDWGCLVTEDRSDCDFSMVTKYCLAEIAKRDYTRLPKKGASA